MAIKKADRIKVLVKYSGHCAYCGKEITIKSMQVDHVVSKRAGGADTFENYNPSCRRCNHYKRARNIESFRRLLLDMHNRLKADYLFKIAIDYGIAEIKPFNGEFYFEKVEDGEIESL